MPNTFADRLFGIVPPVITPLTDDGRFDRASAERLYQYHLDAGVHGVFLFGSSGEGPYLSDDDRAAAIRTAVEVIDGRVPVLVGVLAPGTRGAIAEALIARDLGADCVVVCPPYYYTVSQDELLEHFRAVREQVKLPVMAYDIPSRTHLKMALNTMLTLAREGTCVGVKDSSGDAVGFRRLLSKRPKGFKLLTGNELLIDAVLMSGADGSVPGMANVAPELFVQLYEHWRAGRTAEAAQVQETVVRLFEIFSRADGSFETGYILGVMKTAMKLRGVIASSRLSLPFRKVTEEQEQRVRSLMSEFGLL